MNSIETIFLGVVSGVITTVFLFIIGKLTSSVIIPWYQRIIYRGIDLQDRWTHKAEGPDNSTYTYQLDLKQNAHLIYGTGVIAKSGTKHDYIQDFTIEGETWEGYVTLNLRSSNRKSMSFVSGLFQVDSRGSSLTGTWCYRGSHPDKVKSEDLTLCRANS